MPHTSKISPRQLNFLKLCFFLSVPLLFLFSCSSTAPTPTPQPQPQPVATTCADATIDLGPHYPLPQSNTLCSGNQITWNHTDPHGSIGDFIIVFTPPTSTPFPKLPSSSTNGVLVSGAAVQPSGTNGDYTYSITFTGHNPPPPIPDVHVIVLGTKPGP